MRSVCGKKRGLEVFFRIFVAFPIISLLILYPGASLTAAETGIPRETDKSQTGDYEGLPIAAFEARTTSGNTVSTRGFDGRVLVLDLWGLNCVSCLEEMKALERVYQEYREKGLVVWALNTEMADADRITEGLKERGVEVSYDLLLDPDLEITKRFTRWFIPVTIIVDSEGVVQYYKIGFRNVDIESIRAKVGVLLEE